MSNSKVVISLIGKQRVKLVGVYACYADKWTREFEEHIHKGVLKYTKYSRWSIVYFDTKKELYKAIMSREVDIGYEMAEEAWDLRVRYDNMTARKVNFNQYHTGVLLSVKSCLSISMSEWHNYSSKQVEKSKKWVRHIVEKQVQKLKKLKKWIIVYSRKEEKGIVYHRTDFR